MLPVLAASKQSMAFAGSSHGLISASCSDEGCHSRVSAMVLELGSTGYAFSSRVGSTKLSFPSAAWKRERHKVIASFSIISPSGVKEAIACSQV